MGAFILKLVLVTILIIIGKYVDVSLQPEFIGGGIILLFATVLVDGV